MASVAALAIHCAVGTSSANKAKAQSIEYWNTSEGELQLQSKGRNNYAGNFKGNMLLGQGAPQGISLGTGSTASATPHVAITP